jgi:hypothetical protein
VERSDFGYVVGDVPTTRRADLPAGSARDAYDEYGNATAAYDLSMLFLERAGGWLAQNGQLSMAVNGNLLGAPSAADARRRLVNTFQLRELVEFDTGSATAPLFIAGVCRGTTGDWQDNGADESASAEEIDYEFTYARVTPTFIELVREGLVRPDGSGNAHPADLVGRCLPDEAGGDPPSMETVLVELDLVCDATVEGPMPVEVETVESAVLAGSVWEFAAASGSMDPGTIPSPDDARSDGETVETLEPWLPSTEE